MFHTKNTTHNATFAFFDAVIRLFNFALHVTVEAEFMA